MIKIKILKNSLLSERLTDTIYGSIAGFLNEELSNQKNFYASIRLYGHQQESDTYFPAVVIYFKSPPDWKKKYEEYKQYTGDDKIIDSASKLQLMMQKLRIFILPGIIRPDAGGDMSSNGVMRVFLPSWKPEPVSSKDIQNINLFSPSIENIKTVWNKKEAELGKEVGRTARNVEKALDGVNAGRFAKYIENVFAHEIGHYINAIRSTGKDFKPKDFRAKGKSKQFDPSTKEYARSTEEWQARYTEVLYQIQKAFKIKFPDLQKDSEAYKKISSEDDYTTSLKDVERQLKKKYEAIMDSSGIPFGVFELLRSVAVGDFLAFSIKMKELTNFYDRESKLGVTIPKRINSRIYSLFQELEKKIDHPLFKVLTLEYTLGN